MPITADMQQYIAANFQPSDQAAAIGILATAIIHDGTAANPRLLRCALVGACGSLLQLQQLVQLLRVDWRDVIMAGEYECKSTEPVRIRDLNEPFALDKG